MIVRRRFRKGQPFFPSFDLRIPGGVRQDSLLKEDFVPACIPGGRSSHVV